MYYIICRYWYTWDVVNSKLIKQKHKITFTDLFSYWYICCYVLYSLYIPTLIKNLMANFEKIDRDLVLDFWILFTFSQYAICIIMNNITNNKVWIDSFWFLLSNNTKQDSTKIQYFNQIPKRLLKEWENIINYNGWSQ